MEERRICENDMIQNPELEILQVHAKNNKRINAKPALLRFIRVNEKEQIKSLNSLIVFFVNLI